MGGKETVLFGDQNVSLLLLVGEQKGQKFRRFRPHVQGLPWNFLAHVARHTLQVFVSATYGRPT